MYTNNTFTPKILSIHFEGYTMALIPNGKLVIQQTYAKQAMLLENKTASILKIA